MCRCRSLGSGPAATTTARLPSWGTGPAGALDTRGTSHGHQEYDRVNDATGRPSCRVPPRACERSGQEGPVSVSGLVGLDDAGRDAAPVADGVTVLAGPVTNG